MTEGVYTKDGYEFDSRGLLLTRKDEVAEN